MPKLQFHCSTFKSSGCLKKRSIPASTLTLPINKQKVSISVKTPHFKVANGAIAHVNETCKNNEHQSSKGASDCPPEELPSPSTARQEQLIARFAGTIINAQNKMLQLDIDQGKVSKLTEKQKLDKHRMEARYLMDAQLKVDATKKRREMEREAINKMEGIAQLNLESMRETEDFMKRMENVSSEELRKLGLFLKVDDVADFMEFSC